MLHCLMLSIKLQTHGDIADVLIQTSGITFRPKTLIKFYRSFKIDALFEFINKRKNGMQYAWEEVCGLFRSRECM